MGKLKMNNIFATKLQKIKFLPILLTAYLCAIVILIFKPRTKYVIGGHAGELFEDNGKAFYQYLITRSDVNNRDVIWYTASKKGIEGVNTRRIGSFLGYFDYFTAKCALYTHSSSTDLAPLAFHFKYRRPTRIYLDHGIDGLKKIGWVSKIEPADGYVVASSVGLRIKQEYWHVSPKRIIDTGLARYDRLFDSIQENDTHVHRILYLPTWREWNYGLSRDAFVETDYFKSIKSFLCDENLKKILAMHSVTLHVELHPFCESYKDVFEELIVGSNIEIGIEAISKEITHSDALITDYSSVCWDFLYQNKSTIFYQFDQDKYISERGAYLDLNEDLFGPVCRDAKATVEQMKILLSNNMIVSEDKRQSYFTHIDNQNCRRVFDEIQSMVGDHL